MRRRFVGGFCTSMIRIACLGNSHNAAFKLGWDEIKSSYPNVTIDFFSGAANAMKQLEVRQGRIFPTTEAVREMFVAYGGQESIASDYDIYVLVGMGFGLVPLMALFAKHRPLHFYSAAGDTHLISDTLLDEARQTLIEGSPAIKCLDLVKKIAGDTPIFMVPNPFPSADITERQSTSYWLDENLLDDCNRYLDRAISRLTGVNYIPQPEATLASTYLTKSHYAKEARLLKARWTRPTNDGDPYHMNSAYGIDVLRFLFDLAGIKSSE
ncbi:hypothetical protein, Rkp3_015 (plasmid) [Sinorhizobium fredii NGR234]|uniref:Uncharacterized protein n=3 Tax=Rhizobium fredii TaxID=380 RepID=C3KQN8_SINFN|nr:hypothetical protein, Rkp3_015 [Sinorhizobium fredii NGR234]